MKKQVVLIHGGETFDTYKDYVIFLRSMILNLNRLFRKSWKDTLAQKLGKDFQVIAPRMPNGLNAKYLEWKIWFDKLVPLFHKKVILVGHSLGGIFLAKYLAENNISKHIAGLFLVSPPYDDKNAEYSLAYFILPASLKKIEKQAPKIFIYFSEDDSVVPFADLKKYQNKLPKAKVIVFKNRGHFSGEEFPEIVRDIKNL